jgi:ankyrin repeat protein
LRRGADVHARNIKADSDFYGMTPLIMNASQKDDCAEVTELLVGAGAELGAVDGKRKTALDYAVDRGNQRVEAILRRAG